MTQFPVVVSQRFWPIRLNELIDHQSYLPQKYVESKKPRQIIEDLIREVRYPWYLGKPDDSHTYNAYHSQYRWCKKITEDYWDSGSEVLATKVADCDGSAIVGCTCLRAAGVEPENVYVVFGYVQDAGTGEILGGHAWLYVRHDDFGDGWRYAEMTLDQPPKQYPRVPDIRKPFTWGNWRLVPEILWNDQKYEEVKLGLDISGLIARFRARIIKIGANDIVKVGYMHLTHREKETRRKYRALSDMWRLPVKPLRKAGLLSRLRWRK